MRKFWGIGLSLLGYGLALVLLNIPKVFNALLELVSGGRILTPPDISHVAFHPALAFFLMFSGIVVVLVGKLVTENE